MIRIARHGMILVLAGCLLLTIENLLPGHEPGRSELNEARRWAQAGSRARSRSRGYSPALSSSPTTTRSSRNARGGQPLEYRR